jgi:hypothetical protein
MENDVLIQGFGATDGRVNDVSSYQADICGNVATFAVFTLIHQVYGCSPPNIEHVCDNQSSITATWKDENISVFEKSKPDADVAKVDRSSIADIRQYSIIKLLWVQGHSDKRGPPYSLEEELNIIADSLAGKAQTNLPTDMKPLPDCLHFPAQQISVITQQRRVTSHLPHHISNAIHGPKLTEHVLSKDSWTTAVFQSIDWDSLQIAFNKLSTARQIVTTKMLYNYGVPMHATYAKEVTSKNVGYVVTKTRTGATYLLANALVQ